MNCADQVPSPLLSREEKAVLVLLVVAAAVGLTALGLTLMMVYWALPRPGQPVDVGQLVLSLALFSVVFFGIVFAIFGRWPGRVSSQANMDLKASPYDVWDAVALRDDYPGWKNIYIGIERLDERGEVYRLHYATDAVCARCSLPKDPDRPLWSSRVEILESRRPSLYRQRSFPKGLWAGEGKMDRLLDSEDSTMLLHPLPGGGTRLTFRSTVVRPKPWMAFLTMLGRPGKEHLRSLKAHLEGTPDESLFGISAKRMKAARNAPQHCNCPESR